MFQPVLGKVADAWSYAASYVVSAAVQLFALPFILLARKQRPVSDVIERSKSGPTPVEPPAER